MAGPAGAEGETAEPRKERSHTRRMRPPVRRNLQKSVLAVKEESTSKEAVPAAVRPKAPRMRQEPTQKAPEKEPVRRLTEQKKEKLLEREKKQATKKQRLDEMLAKVRKKYGDNAIHKGSES